LVAEEAPVGTQALLGVGLETLAALASCAELHI
jgi:hypothetical protein